MSGPDSKDGVAQLVEERSQARVEAGRATERFNEAAVVCERLSFWDVEAVPELALVAGLVQVEQDGARVVELVGERDEKRTAGFLFEGVLVPAARGPPRRTSSRVYWLAKQNWSRNPAFDAGGMMVSKASASPADYGYHNERAGHDRPSRELAQREA